MTRRRTGAQLKQSAIMLPPGNVVRWTVAHKRAIVEGVTRGMISRDEAMDRYTISEDELEEWRAAYAALGKVGLKATVRTAAMI